MHLATYARADAGPMLAHYERAIGDREHIDREGRVYNAAPSFEGGCQARFKELCEGLEIGAKTKPLADWVVTKPSEFECDTAAFFKAAYEFMAGRVGADRVVSAYVHLDEPGAEPHMHFAFVPIVETPVMTNDKTQPLRWTAKDEKKNPAHKAGEIKRDSKGTVRYKRVPALDEQGRPVVRRTATASKLFTQRDMAEIHPAIEAHLCRALGVSHVGMLLNEADKSERSKKKLSKLDHDDYVDVTAEIERAEKQAVRARAEAERATRQAYKDVVAARQRVSQANGRAEAAEQGAAAAEARLEGLRRAEEAEAAEVAELDRAIEQAGLQPPAETLAQSARTLYKARSDGEREEGLGSEIERLRSRISGLERANQQARGRMADLDRALPGLRERCRGLRARFEDAQVRVREVIGRLREVPETVSAWALDIAKKMGKRTYDPRSLEYQIESATRSAAIDRRQRGGVSHGRDWGRGIDR